jgi:hypothetical protein
MTPDSVTFVLARGGSRRVPRKNVRTLRRRFPEKFNLALTNQNILRK